MRQICAALALALALAVAVDCQEQRRGRFPARSERSTGFVARAHDERRSPRMPARLAWANPVAITRQSTVLRIACACVAMGRGQGTMRPERRASWRGTDLA
jgi:hypothetical protein